VFDFRYHALSLVAVFLALGIGIILGASLGDSVVSEANKDVRSSLRGDLIDARNDARTETQAVAHRDAFINAAFARLAGASLRRVRVAVVASGGLPQDVEGDVRATVKDAGGQIDSASKFDAAPDLVDLGKKLGGRYAHIGTRPAKLRPLTRRLARALVSGGPVADKLKADFPDAFSGDFRGAAAVVYFHAAVKRDTPSQRFEAALVEGLRRAGVPVVGVETSETDPSQIPWYVTAGLASVDDVDQPAGRVALALALAGARGNFGYKQTADAPLPKLPAPAKPTRGGKRGKRGKSGNRG
jgi:hypothetical protein